MSEYINLRDRLSDLNAQINDSNRSLGEKMNLQTEIISTRLQMQKVKGV